MANVLQKNWQDLIKPQKLQIEIGRDKTKNATMVAEPLERGFGMTLGNALRRVLLSSLQGAAIKTVQIDGVLHEFSSINGVREDVTDIVLNIKEIALRIHSDGVKRMVLKKDVRGPVKAGDIDVIVCERFIITAQTGKLSQAPWSLEQIGALRFFAHRLGIPFELQSAADAKRFATEDKLRRAAWARPKGAGHARDAQRHLLVYLVRRNLFDASVLIGG